MIKEKAMKKIKCCYCRKILIAGTYFAIDTESGKRICVTCIARLLSGALFTLMTDSHKHTDPDIRQKP